jgi:serine/threonine-protein kinase
MWDLGVVQALVGFPSPELAQKFFADQGALWTACANRTVTVTPPDQSPVQTWTFGTPRNVDAMLTITYHQGSNGGGCQRALTVRGNTAIDVTACDSDPMIENRAGTIAGNIAAKAP